MQTKERYDWADFMRGIMMFMVVLYHSEVYYGPKHSWSWFFEPVFLSGFFFISGYLFTRDITIVSLTSKIKQVVRSIIIPYFFFTLVMALPKVLVGHAGMSLLMIDIILLRASWFVITIGVLQIIYAFLLNKTPSIKKLLIATLVMFGIGYAMALMYKANPSWLHDNRWLNSPEQPNRLPLCINIAVIQSPFFLFGILYRKNEMKWSIPMGKTGFLISSILYLVFYVVIDHKYWGSVMWVAGDYYENILLIFIYAILGIWSMMCISKIIRSWKPINYIGKHSILFYFLNGGALTAVSALMKLVHYLDPNNYWNQFLIAIIATALMFPCVWFINKYLPLLKGDKESFNRLSERLGVKGLIG